MAENPIEAFDIDQVMLLAMRDASKDAREDTRDAMEEIARSVRERVASGDTGTVVTGSTAPGWGGGGLLAFVPALALIAVAGVGGAVLGATGVFGSERVEVVSGYTAVLDETAPAAACPGGPVIGSLSAGDRVLAVARSDDSAFLGVRDPNDFARTLWFERSIVIVDGGQADIASLPVDSCPEALVQVVEPTPVPTEEPTGPDTVGPILANANASPNPISMEGYPECGPTASIVTVNATDPAGIDSVTATWMGGNAALNRSGNTWSFSFSEATIASADTDYKITISATDSVGNTASTVVTVTVEYCLI